MARKGRRLSQSDIAERLGVSVSTVSRALANEVGISPAVRQDVLTLAHTLGYKSKRLGAGPAERRVAAFVPLGGAASGLSGFYLEIAEGMRAAAARAGFALDIRLINESSVSLDVIRRQVEQIDAAGLLLAGIDPNDDIAAWTTAAGLPTVLVNGSDPTMRISSVSPSNYYGAFRATQRLLEAGHRRLIHFTHKYRPTILERRRGFEAAIAATPGAQGQVINSQDLSQADFTARLLAGGFDATALFVWNDVVAVEILDALSNATTRLPQHFSIIGFDDLPIASLSAPRLSTMLVDREAIAAASIRLLRQQMEGVTGVQQLEIGVTAVAGETVHRHP